LPIAVRKLLLIVGQSVVPPFPLLMDLFPLRYEQIARGSTSAEVIRIRPLTQPVRLASWQVERSGAVLYRGWIPSVTLYEIRRLASRCPSRESPLLVQFSIALKEEIIAL
jgi:hypothetical protein